MIGRWIFVRERAMTRRDWLALAGLFGLGLALMFPLRLVFAWGLPDNVTARSVEGSVWDGRVADLRVGPMPLGTLDAGLAPLPLLLGRAEFVLSRGGDVPFFARASGNAGAVRLSGVNGTLALPDGLGALPVTALGFGDLSLRMEDGRCVAAQGTMSLTLASPGPMLPDALVLSGQARCANGALVVPMQATGGMEKLTLRIAGDGKWQADLVLSGLPAEVSGPLVQGGFTARPGGIGIRTSGSF